MKTTSRPGCATPNMARKANCHPNPAPGSTPQAASAAKEDASKREGTVIGAMKAAVTKMMSTAPKPTPAPNPSAQALADKKDQTAKLKNEY